MSEGHTNKPEDFHAAVGDLTEALDRQAASGVHALLDTSGLFESVRDGSVADQEIGGELAYAGPWDQLPTHTTISIAQLLVLAGEDSMRAFCDLLSGGRIPLFAHSTVARSSLETLGLAYWLLSSDVDGAERARRCLNVRLHSALEQQKVPKRYRPADDSIETLLSAAETFGVTIKGSPKNPSVGSPIPNKTSLICSLLGGDVGRAMYSVLSATTHGVVWGMTQSVVPTSAVDPGQLGDANLVVSTSQVLTTAQALAVAHHTCYRSFADYCGWDTSGYDKSFKAVAALL